jgi:hypothetical protein
MTVVVLSGSPLAEDIGASLALGAHAYWTKVADAKRQDVIAQEITELIERRVAKAEQASSTGRRIDACC